MYRTGDTNFLAVLLGAHTFDDFATRWYVLGRMNRQDVAALRRLERLRRRAKVSSTRLMALQSQAARRLDELSAQERRARKDLANSKAALAEFERRTTRPPAKPADSKPARDSTQQRTGSGAWSVAVASHYGLNFHGRGASGSRIGPYSMMCAHKTLPFGTLVEFEYNGHRAVAKVADRGPYTRGRTFDLGPGVIRVLGFRGVHKIRYRVIGR